MERFEPLSVPMRMSERMGNDWFLRAVKLWVQFQVSLVCRLVVPLDAKRLLGATAGPYGQSSVGARNKTHWAVSSGRRSKIPEWHCLGLLTWANWRGRPAVSAHVSRRSERYTSKGFFLLCSFVLVNGVVGHCHGQSGVEREHTACSPRANPSPPS